jgi:hypothetical protein
MAYEQHRLATRFNAEHFVPQLQVMIREVEGILDLG